MTMRPAPNGLRPSSTTPEYNRHTTCFQGGTGGAATPFGTSATIYNGTPVMFTTTGFIVPVTGTANQILGMFEGYDYVDTTFSHRRHVLNNLTNPPPNFDPIGPVNAYVQVATDDMEFTIQCAGTLSASILPGAELFLNVADLGLTPAGNGVTGLSSCRADGTTVVGAGQGQLIYMGIANTPENAVTDPYPVIRVKVSRPQTFAPFLRS